MKKSSKKKSSKKKSFKHSWERRGEISKLISTRRDLAAKKGSKKKKKSSKKRKKSSKTRGRAASNRLKRVLLTAYWSEST